MRFGALGLFGLSDSPSAEVLTRDLLQYFPVLDINFATGCMDSSRALHVGHQTTNGFFPQAQKVGHVHAGEGQSEATMAML